MAFSAQIDHGQNERKDAVLCEISNETSKDKGKVCACFVAFYCAPSPSCFVCKTAREGLYIFAFGALADRV